MALYRLSNLKKVALYVSACSCQSAEQGLLIVLKLECKSLAVVGFQCGTPHVERPFTRDVRLPNNYVVREGSENNSVYLRSALGPCLAFLFTLFRSVI